MGFKSSVEKLDKYYKRLDEGKAQKITASHVERVIRKLEAKEKLLLEEISESEKDSKTERLEGKLETVRGQLERGRWLLEEVSEK